jgi:predicted acylesterase/phospholipase RssA
MDAGSAARVLVERTLAQPFFAASYPVTHRLAQRAAEPALWRHQPLQAANVARTLRSVSQSPDPLKTRLAELVDFSRLNGGEVRVSVATTDIETGELVIFDTARGHRIELDHVLASCGFLPEFPAVEIDGRLLGDGGLSANAPVEAL